MFFIPENSINLTLRTHAINLCSEFERSGESLVTYDLAKIEVMSRTFADQLYKEIARLQTIGVQVALVNMCQQVQEVMEAVAKTQHTESKSTVKYIERSFTADTMGDFFKLLDGKLELV